MRPDQQRIHDQARERAQEMARLKDEGQSLEAIGKAFGVTRERVRQILVEEARRRGRPFRAANARTPRFCEGGCGKEIAKANISGYCKECKPTRHGRDWTTRAVEKGIYRNYNPSTGEWFSARRRWRS